MTDPELVRIPGQTTVLGSDRHYPEEAPARPVTVDGFWIQARPVTNADFAEFVSATGYLTVAERPLNPADYPGAPAAEPAAGLDGVPPHQRARRPAPPQPVVGLDSRRLVAASAGPELVDR